MSTLDDVMDEYDRILRERAVQQEKERMLYATTLVSKENEIRENAQPLIEYETLKKHPMWPYCVDWVQD
jgi:hypothetical protein